MRTSARWTAARYGMGLWLVLLLLAGCNSGGDAPQQVAQVRSASEEGAFRNLGKRTSIDYGDVGAGVAPSD